MIHGDLIGRWGRACPDKEALVDALTGRRYAYGQLAQAINRLANFLRADLGIKRGDLVACLSTNRAEYIFLFFALGRLGAGLVPLNLRLAPAEFAYFLQDAQPKAFFFEAAQAETAGRLRAGSTIAHWVDFDGGIPWSSLSPAEPPEVEVQASDPALLIYTSGTTGAPKGAVLTQGMLLANAVNTVLGWDLSSADRTILHPAMFYTAGWNVFTLPLFLARATNVLVKSFDPELILSLIQEERITVFFGVPTMFRMLLDSPAFSRTDLSSLRFVVSGGAPLPAEVREEFRRAKGLRLWEGYGLTEVGPNNFMANGKPGTVGHPMPLVDVRLIDGQGNQVGPGQEGEILLRGAHVCAGYWRKPEATAEAIDPAGWFHTGDLGTLDGDGHLAIVGRKKDLIISGGANIYPAEVEAAIMAHPAVAGAAVIGVPDPKWGEVGKAVVELKPDAALTWEEFQAFMAERLGKFKIPKYLKVIPELPRTPASGKVQKFILKKRHGGADHD